MDENLTQIRESLARLEASIQRIEQILLKTQTSCCNMDEHIAFIDGVYASVRRPLSFLASRFTGSKPLPLHNSERSSYGEPAGHRHIRDKSKILERLDFEHECHEHSEHDERDESDPS